MSSTRVPVETLREAVEASGLTHSEIAERLGWRRWDDHGWDGRRVARLLGLRSQHMGTHKGKDYGLKPRAAVNQATADRLLAALRVDASLVKQPCSEVTP